MPFHLLAGYLLALFLAGFLLWLLRAFVRWLRRKDAVPGEAADDQPAMLSDGMESEQSENVPVDWPVHLFLSRHDDLEIPGRLVALMPAGGLLRCSARLSIGQVVSLYIDVPGSEQCRVSARVLWLGEGPGRSPLARLRFEGLANTERARLLRVAGEGRRESELVR